MCIYIYLFTHKDNIYFRLAVCLAAGLAACMPAFVDAWTHACVHIYGWLAKLMVPFWVPSIVRHLLFRVPKKGP